MKLKLVYLVVMTALYIPTGAAAFAADAGSCYTITDPDLRALCRAKAHQEPSICYSIKRQDLKAECMAETRK